MAELDEAVSFSSYRKIKTIRVNAQSLSSDELDDLYFELLSPELGRERSIIFCQDLTTLNWLIEYPIRVLNKPFFLLHISMVLNQLLVCDETNKEYFLQSTPNLFASLLSTIVAIVNPAKRSFQSLVGQFINLLSQVEVGNVSEDLTLRAWDDLNVESDPSDSYYTSYRSTLLMLLLPVDESIVEQECRYALVYLSTSTVDQPLDQTFILNLLVDMHSQEVSFIGQLPIMKVLSQWIDDQHRAKRILTESNTDLVFELLTLATEWVADHQPNKQDNQIDQALKIIQQFESTSVLAEGFIARTLTYGMLIQPHSIASFISKHRLLRLLDALPGQSDLVLECLYHFASVASQYQLNVMLDTPELLTTLMKFSQNNETNQKFLLSFVLGVGRLLDHTHLHRTKEYQVIVDAGILQLLLQCRTDSDAPVTNLATRLIKQYFPKTPGMIYFDSIME